MGPKPSYTKEELLLCCKTYPNLSDAELARKLIKEVKQFQNLQPETLRGYINRIKKFYGLNNVVKKAINLKKEKNLKEDVKKFIEKPKSLLEICDKFNAPPKTIQAILDELIEEKFNVVLNEDSYHLSSDIKEGGKHSIDITAFENKTFKFGFVTDNHLNSKYARLDILNAIYDIYKQEGIKIVYNAGNWVDGEARFNKYDVINNGITPQIDYFVKNYPQREGITTYYIAGDDHEGWWVQREKMNIGEYSQLMAEKAGRHDLKYLGYIEADVSFKTSKGKAIMKIMHPGGGSAYALSYAPQKIVESFTGGEKPQILLLGHYHKSEYMPSYRNVQIVQGGTTQDQTPFMRKKKIAAHLGGWIIEVQISKDGTVNRFKTEWLSFMDRGYYKKKGYYR